MSDTSGSENVRTKSNSFFNILHSSLSLLVLQHLLMVSLSTIKLPITLWHSLELTGSLSFLMVIQSTFAMSSVCTSMFSTVLSQPWMSMDLDHHPEDMSMLKSSLQYFYTHV